MLRQFNAFRLGCVRIMKQNAVMMGLGMIGLYDRGSRWLIGGVQHDHLLSWDKLHGSNIGGRSEISNSLMDNNRQMICFIGFKRLQERSYQSRGLRLWFCIFVFLSWRKCSVFFVSLSLSVVAICVADAKIFSGSAAASRSLLSIDCQ
jgi:hypothetical protein